MTLNNDLSQSRFEDIQQSLERLRQMAELSRSAFLADQDTVDVACYRLLVATAIVVRRTRRRPS